MTNGTAPPEPGTRMTLRVYTVTRTGALVEDRGTVSVLSVRECPPPPSDFPPCSCPRCLRGRHPRTGAAPSP